MSIPWWLDFNAKRALARSKQENRLVRAIWLIFMLLFVFVYYLCIWALAGIGLPHSMADFAGAIVGVPLTFYVARGICWLFWPDLVKDADENAKRRLSTQ